MPLGQPPLTSHGLPVDDAGARLMGRACHAAPVTDASAGQQVDPPLAPLATAGVTMAMIHAVVAGSACGLVAEHDCISIGTGGYLLSVVQCGRSLLAVPVPLDVGTNWIPRGATLPSACGAAGSVGSMLSVCSLSTVTAHGGKAKRPANLAQGASSVEMTNGCLPRDHC